MRMLRIVPSIDVYVHVHWKATAKSNHAMKMRGPSLYFFVVCDGRKPKARIAQIVKCKGVENLQNLLKSRNVLV